MDFDDMIFSWEEINVGCRCSDIRTCNREIRKMQGIISNARQYKASCQVQLDEYKDIILEANTSYELQDGLWAELLNKVSRQIDNAEESIEEFQHELEKGLRRLREELSDMESEDDSYHDDDDD